MCRRLFFYCVPGVPLLSGMHLVCHCLPAIGRQAVLRDAEAGSGYGFALHCLNAFAFKQWHTGSGTQWRRCGSRVPLLAGVSRQAVLLEVPPSLTAVPRLHCLNAGAFKQWHTGSGTQVVAHKWRRCATACRPMAGKQCSLRPSTLPPMHCLNAFAFKQWHTYTSRFEDCGGSGWFR